MPTPDHRTAIVWFRRDLRLADQPTLIAAGESAETVLAVFVLDPALLRPSGEARTAFLFGCLRELDRSLGGRLLIVQGDPAKVLPRVASAADASSVHIAADYGPYGGQRDVRVREALDAQGVDLVATGSPYAVAPGRVRNGSGERFKVFTPFRRAWLDHGWPAPAQTSAHTVEWMDPGDLDVHPAELPDVDSSANLPEPGERAALAAWHDFVSDQLEHYGSERSRPQPPGSSRMSPYLKLGCVHPRTMLADLADGRRAGVAACRSELAWREFYADVLFHRPETARENYDKAFDALPRATGKDADRAFQAWCDGRTGFPIVDAGMRQLKADAWLPNRIRMIVASFLVKDLHLPWQWGARHFMRLLVDGDLASNQHNWQWVAGCGTDAAPYFRIFNPTTQAERFDPDGTYVRTWVPELAHVQGKQVHQPWRLPRDEVADYPEPIVDHAEERQEALAGYELVKAARG